jgi:hypothetical protein
LYARAREAQADYYAAEITEIADTCRVGEKIKELPSGAREITTADMVERSKLMVDTRKWLMAKLAPKRYGDRLELHGELSHNLTLSPAETLRKRRQALLAGPAQIEAPEQK